MTIKYDKEKHPHGKCFIAMPLSVRDFEHQDKYDRRDHFQVVLANIFVPAVLKAGYCPVLPLQSATVEITGEIVDSILDSDMMLIDISTRNPNVYIELGIRTAHNKPVTLVRDDDSTIPFDQATLNTREYSSNLSVDSAQRSIETISSLLIENKEMKTNVWWQRFAYRHVPPSMDTKDIQPIDRLTFQVESLTETVESFGKILRKGSIGQIGVEKSSREWSDNYRRFFGEKAKASDQLMQVKRNLRGIFLTNVYEEVVGIFDYLEEIEAEYSTSLRLADNGNYLLSIKIEGFQSAHKVRFHAVSLQMKLNVIKEIEGDSKVDIIIVLPNGTTLSAT